MECKDIISSYLRTLQGNFVCKERENRLWVISPYSFPDGDLIEIVVLESSNQMVKVTDLGETLRHLSDLGFDIWKSLKGQYLIEDVEKRFNIKIESGQIVKRAQKSELGNAIFDVISSCLAISDLIYLSRAYQPATFPQEVAHYFTENQISYEKKYSITGSTGKKYKVDFYFPQINGKEGMLQTLSPKGVQGIKPVVDATFRLWSDVGNNRWLGTLMDDRIIKWKTEDIELLKRVSHVHFWEQRNRLLEEIKHV